MPAQRWLVAMLKHETNTFSPVPTDLARFRAWGLHEGAAVQTAYRGTNHPIAAFLDLAAEAGAEVVTPVAAEAMPAGPVHRDAYDYLTGRICDALADGGFDAAFLDLHGAMVPEGMDDGEGPLLARLRTIAPRLPICVTFDMHGNMTGRIMSNVTVVNGYKHYPHTDMYDTGMAAGRAMLRALNGQVHPVVAWGQAPILAQTLRMGTADEPMRTMQDLTRELERDPAILLASVFGGFPMADIPDAGLSVVVVADGDRAKAQAGVDRLLAAAFARRDEFVYRHEPLAAAVARAKALAVAPVILLDHADNVGSGGSADCMTVIAEVLRQGLDAVAVAAVWDPAAVAAMAKAGLGARITLPLGGRTDMPAIGLAGTPLTLTGTVRALTDGRWTVRGPMYTGTQVTTGPTAVLQVEGVSIVVTSLHHEPWDAGILTNNGLDPAACRFILLKSRIHYRAGFAPIGKATVTLDGTGVTTSDNAILRYQRLRRPIHPLDPL